MTTAHRPTWKAAVGKANEGGWTAGGAASTQKSSLDAPAQLSLKLRAKPVDRKQALKESLLALEEAEQKATTSSSSSSNHKFAFHNSNRPQIEQDGKPTLKLLKPNADAEDDGGGGGKRKAKDADDPVHDADADEEDESDLDADDDDSSKSEDDDDDDDDDEEALQAELAKIRAEREEARRQEAEQEQVEEEEAALVGNPLLAVNAVGLSAAGAHKRRRRWNDDVVFRNQAKGEPKQKKRFINDTVRNDYHKRFLNKFIR